MDRIKSRSGQPKHGLGNGSSSFMDTQIATCNLGRSPYISRGRLPPPEQVMALVADAHARFNCERDGEDLETFAPLDEAGKSVKGQLVARFLSQRMGKDLCVSKRDACGGVWALCGSCYGRLRCCNHCKRA